MIPRQVASSAQPVDGLCSRTDALQVDMAGQDVGEAVRTAKLVDRLC